MTFILSREFENRIEAFRRSVIADIADRNDLVPDEDGVVLGDFAMLREFGDGVTEPDPFVHDLKGM